MVCGGVTVKLVLPPHRKWWRGEGIRASPSSLGFPQGLMPRKHVDQLLHGAWGRVTSVLNKPSAQRCGLNFRDCSIV